MFSKHSIRSGLNATMSPVNNFFKPVNDVSNIQSKPLENIKIQRKCFACQNEEQHKAKLQHNHGSGTEGKQDSPLQNYIPTLPGSGESLAGETLDFYEPRFGHSFSSVRIHTDTEAQRSAQSINSLAYTAGNNIVFNQGQYSPNTEPGKKLLAHELTHVVQNKTNVASPIKRKEFSSKGRANDETPGIINGAVIKSDMLKKYVGEQRIKAAFLNSDNFNIIQKYELEEFGKKCNQGNINDAGGFFCRSVRNAKDKKFTGDIFVVKYLKLGHVLHEFIHKLSGVTVKNFLGTFVNEGVTQHFTELFLKEGQHEILTDHKYQKNLECARKIIDASDEETVAKAYFNNDNKLVTQLQNLLKLKSINDVNSYFDTHECIP